MLENYGGFIFFYLALIVCLFMFSARNNYLNSENSNSRNNNFYAYQN